MRFDLEQAIEVLSATPVTLRSLIAQLSADWTESAVQADEWRAFDVIGHLIHGEETDWIPRAGIIIDQSSERTFVAFDRFAQFERSELKSLGELLDEFAERRAENLETLRAWNLSTVQLDLPGMHPELGEVTLKQLLATWVVHDLNHIRQIVTVMAARYGDEVGPWREHLSILKY